MSENEERHQTEKGLLSVGRLSSFLSVRPKLLLKKALNTTICLYAYFFLSPDGPWNRRGRAWRSAYLRAFDVKGKKITYFLEPKHLAQVVVEYILHF